MPPHPAARGYCGVDVARDVSLGKRRRASLIKEGAERARETSYEAKDEAEGSLYWRGERRKERRMTGGSEKGVE